MPGSLWILYDCICFLFSSYPVAVHWVGVIRRFYMCVFISAPKAANSCYHKGILFSHLITVSSPSSMSPRNAFPNFPISTLCRGKHRMKVLPWLLPHSTKAWKSSQTSLSIDSSFLLLKDRWLMCALLCLVINILKKLQTISALE